MKLMKGVFQKGHSCIDQSREPLQKVAFTHEMTTHPKITRMVIVENMSCKASFACRNTPTYLIHCHDRDQIHGEQVVCALTDYNSSTISIVIYLIGDANTTIQCNTIIQYFDHFDLLKLYVH